MTPRGHIYGCEVDGCREMATHQERYWNPYAGWEMDWRCEEHRLAPAEAPPAEGDDK